MAAGAFATVGAAAAQRAHEPGVPPGPEWVDLALGVVGGLALFLYGVTRLSGAL